MRGRVRQSRTFDENHGAAAIFYSMRAGARKRRFGGGLAARLLCGIIMRVCSRCAGRALLHQNRERSCDRPLYQALYRKWRPQTFADVIGQQHVTDTLRAQLKSGRLSHAISVTGTRGTGKTTCAKILARAVNCEHPVNGDPCNECAACRGILDGSVLDVTEIDAASNNGVDNIRDLRDETRYTPAQVKKRVFIIDEVHMLSIGAFNALLKTLEEPPEHVLFILATTELHKVPATILSRCQRFDFRRIGAEDIARRLLQVADGEGIQLTEGAARLIARLADGAMRDALSMLDRAAAAGAVDEQTVTAALGVLGQDDGVAWRRRSRRAIWQRQSACWTNITTKGAIWRRSMTSCSA